MNHHYYEQNTLLTRKAWEAFQNNEEFDRTLLRSEIYESWLRSKALKLNCYEVTPKLLSQDEFNKLLKKNSLMCQTARPFMQQIFNTIHNSDSAVILSDKNGILLESIYDPSLSSYTDAAHSEIMLTPGSIQSESVIGTTEISLCIRHEKPFQVTGYEFFAEYNKKLSCIGAPIYDELNSLIGVLSLSMSASNFHKHSYGLVVALAEAITKEIALKKSNHELSAISTLLENTLETIPEGLLVINNLGKIIQANSQAEKLLSYDRNIIINQSIDNFIISTSEETKVSKILTEIDREMLVHTSKGTKRFFIMLKAFDSKNNQNQPYRLITLRDPKTVSSFTKKISAFQAKYNFSDIVNQSDVLDKVINIAKLSSKSESTVLITGESGTGKEIFAQAIHNNSNRADGPFVSLNCGALPQNLIESELFGYDTGAFTGAKKGGQLGKFELAHKGTIFLDEIGDMPLAVQVSMLRVLQNKEITRVGGNKPIHLDVRIIAATNKNLLEEVKNNNFREDLYYRLNVIHLQIPPLRSRKEDIPMLTKHFLNLFSRQLNMDLPELSPDVYDAMKKYHWPGNIRELENFVERIINTNAISNIDPQTIIKSLPNSSFTLGSATDLQNNPLVESQNYFSNHFTNLHEIEVAAKEAEKKLISTTLIKVHGNISKCAEILGITRRSLYRKLDDSKFDYKKYREF